MWIFFEYNGTRHRLAVARTSAGTWVGYPGGAAFVPRPSQRRTHTEGPTKAGAITAPMTGRVVQMSVAVGDKVTKGAPLLVLEAMKMEYRLDAPQDGTIATVACKTGDLVDLGAILVTLLE